VPAPAAASTDAARVVLEDIQDPGNLGTILRCAAASGVRDVLLSKGCVDVYSPKVLRAGMGAHFVLNIHEQVDLEAALAEFKGRKLVTYLEGSSSLYSQDLTGPVALVFGNEGAGVSPALLAWLMPGAYSHAGACRIAECGDGGYRLPVRAGEAAGEAGSMLRRWLVQGWLAGMLALPAGAGGCNLWRWISAIPCRLPVPAVPVVRPSSVSTRAGLLLAGMLREQGVDVAVIGEQGNIRQLTERTHWRKGGSYCFRCTTTRCSRNICRKPGVSGLFPVCIPQEPVCRNQPGLRAADRPVLARGGRATHLASCRADCR
jgi:tRNA(Leu) C34 or U34 (ribose-2'-O)-methylase TrmL